MSPLERGGTSGGSLETAPSLDSTAPTPSSPLGGGTIGEQRASARTHEFFHCFRVRCSWLKKTDGTLLFVLAY